MLYVNLCSCNCSCMLPQFNERGYLPPGIYEITWTELKNRFVFNDRRHIILTGLSAVLRLLGQATMI